MATKKSASSAKSATKKAPTSSSAKTTTRVTKVSAAPASTTNSPKRMPASLFSRSEQKRLPYIVLAELVGTFVLTSVATTTLLLSDLAGLFVGLTLTALVLSIGTLSGAHVNPAVTFGLWVAGKVKARFIPVYWLAQFLGAMLAIVLVNTVSENALAVNLGHFFEFSWNIAAVEAVAAAVFLFGVVTVVSKTNLSDSAKALGVGLSLFVAVIVGGTFNASLSANLSEAYGKKAQAALGSNKELPKAPHELYVSGATVNPAVALAVNEKTDTDLRIGTDTTTYSRLGLEVIIGTLAGAALGAGIARLLGRSDA